MSRDCGPLRTGEGLARCLEELRSLKGELETASAPATLQRYNLPLVSIFELRQMLALGEAVAASALARRESRGVHRRGDFPARDDAEYTRHTMVILTDTGPEVVLETTEEGGEPG